MKRHTNNTWKQEQVLLHIRNHYAPIAFVSIVLLFCLFFPSSNYAQCDATVSGVFTYCNSFDNGNPVTGYFVGFRVVDKTGDTLDVVDLDGGAVTNHGKRVDNIGALEPANTSITKLRISGIGADSIEYWYFGPYANGASFNIALVDPNNVCDTIMVASGSYNCMDNTGVSDPGACGPPSGSDPPVPLYYLDFSNEAFDLGSEGGGQFIENKFYIMNRTRERTCCDVGGASVRCMEMIITLDEGDLGLAIDDIGSGNTAGKLYADSLNGFTCTGNTDFTYPFQQGGGESNDAPLCFGDVSARDFIVLSCKSGGNPTFLTIGSLPEFYIPDVVTVGNCNVQVNIFNASSVNWSSPDDPGLDNLSSCQNDSLICSFHYNENVFGPITTCTDTFTYVIGAHPIAESCLPLDTTLYDTVHIVVFSSFDVDINQACNAENDSVILTAVVSSAASGCPFTYSYLWSTGATSSSIIVPASTTEYFVTVTRMGLPSSTCNSIVESILTMPVLPALPFDTICPGQNITFQVNDLNLGSGAIYAWDFGSGATPSTGLGLGPHSVSYVTTTENQLNGASVVLSISTPGCFNASGEVTHIVINDLPDASINTSLVPICYYTDKIFLPQAAEIPGASYYWTFGNDAVPVTATGYGPHTVYYTTSGVKNVKLVVNPNEAGAQCPDSSTVSFTIQNCPGAIVGFILSETNEPIPNISIKLFADNNMDGVADNAIAIRSVTSTSTGLYTMASLTPGTYVIVETQPSGWLTYDDYDISDDGDLVSNISSMDNLIPVTIIVSEVDSMNNFIETSQPGLISGTVFTDADGDLFPDIDEGLDTVILNLYIDTNTDGHADNSIPIATVLTNPNGNYSFSNISVGSYVIVETNPSDYLSVSDFDPTNDFDIVPNTIQDNDTIPLTLTNNESDANNYFIDHEACPLMVTNLNDSGYGSLRYVLGCAESGDTIQFNISLSGQTIQINSAPLIVAKPVMVMTTLTPPITISSNIIGLFSISPMGILELHGMNIIAGLSSGTNGTAFENEGFLQLDDITVTRNPLGSPLDCLIRNLPGSSLFLLGQCVFSQ